MEQLLQGSLPCFFTATQRQTPLWTQLYSSCSRTICRPLSRQFGGGRVSTVVFARQRVAPNKDEGSQDVQDVDLSEEPDETEEEANRRRWITRYWAPWEEKLCAEARFAVQALNLGQGDEPIVSREMFEILDKTDPLMPKEVTWAIDPDAAEAVKNGSIPGTAWKQTMVFTLVPPRDWPPPGWKVDPDELAFIREAHAIEDRTVKCPDLSKAESAQKDGVNLNFPRWMMFMKQYKEWVAANKEILDREFEESGEEYYPGRRRTGKEYVDGMYELPFIEAGQHYAGNVTAIHLYEGAFVNINAVHDGCVPIKRNDWYWVREHVKVGMRVHVEVIAKRDPYRFRFPIELRFVRPNIDHLIFNRFSHPPIFVREREEENMDLVNRETRRPFGPRKRPDPDDPLEKARKQIRQHPYSLKVLLLHIQEQRNLDDEDNVAAGKPPQSQRENVNNVPGERLYLDEDTWVVEEKIGDTSVPSFFFVQHPSELDMTEARKERQALEKERKEARANYKKFIPRFRRLEYIQELQAMHNQRYEDENEAAERDRIVRLEFGLPLEEPGKYADDSFFGENKYNPREKRWRHDYLGDVSGRTGSGRRIVARDHDKAAQGEEAVGMSASDGQFSVETFGLGTDEHNKSFQVLNVKWMDHAEWKRVHKEA